MTSISSIASLTLDQPPSCIAFCPTQPEYFVVGTYHLHQKEEDDSITPPANDAEEEDGYAAKAEAQKRSGSLVVYRLDSDRL